MRPGAAGEATMATRRTIRPDRGASLVEFAFIAPVLLMLLFGMITTGLALNDKQQMTHATREGARYAATVPAAQPFTAGTWATNVRAVVVARSADTLADSDVCVSLVEGSPPTVISPAADFSTSGAPCIADQTFPVSAADPGRRVQVTAGKTRTIDLVLFGAFDVDLESDATVRAESST
jgi:Flp pilus assembly protein TadG